MGGGVGRQRSIYSAVTFSLGWYCITIFFFFSLFSVFAGQLQAWGALQLTTLEFLPVLILFMFHVMGSFVSFSSYSSCRAWLSSESSIPCLTTFPWFGITFPETCFVSSDVCAVPSGGKAYVLFVLHAWVGCEINFSNWCSFSCSLFLLVIRDHFIIRFWHSNQ